MKSLITFIGLVFLSGTSLVKWFEAPRGSYLGEPVTSISLEQPNQLSRSSNDSAQSQGLSIGSLLSKPDNSSPPSPNVAAINKEPTSDGAELSPIKSNAIPRPVQAAIKPATGIEPDDGLSAETNWPPNGKKRHEAIKTAVIPPAPTQDIPHIPPVKKLQNAIVDMELPVRAPLNVSNSVKKPELAGSIKIPEITAKIATIAPPPQPLQTSKTKTLARQKARLEAQAKKRARQNTARKKVKKSVPKKVVKKASASDDWKSAILGND